MMCVQPFGLNLCGTAIEWTAWATIALATVGAISIIVNGFLAWSTHKSAKSAREQVILERRQLDLFQRQLELAEKQFAAAAAAVQPKVHVNVSSMGDSYMGGEAIYVQGSEPAYEVEVWVRGHSRPGETWGLRHATVEFLAAGTKQNFSALPASATEQEACPFRNLVTTDEPPTELCVVGWTWKQLNGTVHRQQPLEQRPAILPPGVA